jgi:hypothetical protein
LFVLRCDVPSRVQCRIEPELEEALDAYQLEHGLTRAQAIRDLLRQALLDPEPFDRGVKEGFFSGWADGKAAWLAAQSEG